MTNGDSCGIVTDGVNGCGIVTDGVDGCGVVTDGFGPHRVQRIAN